MNGWKEGEEEQMTTIRPRCPECSILLDRPEAITLLAKSKVWYHVDGTGKLAEDNHAVSTTRGSRLCANCGYRLNTYLNQHRLALLQGAEEKKE